MPSRFSIGEAESYELPPLGGEIDDGDEDTRDEAAKLLRRSTDGKRFSEEEQERPLRSGGAVELEGDEIVGKGSSVEALIERVSLVSWHQRLAQCLAVSANGHSCRENQLNFRLFRPPTTRACRP